MSFLGRRERDELRGAQAALEALRRQHAADMSAVLEYIGTEIAAAPQCPHNVRPSCGKWPQWRAGLEKALELAREAGDLS